MPRTAHRSLWACAGLGLAGSVLVALAGPRLAGGPVKWWFEGGGGVAGLYAGVAALLVAWLGLGRLAPAPRALWAIAAAWSLPLLLSAPLFSRDAYIYLGQSAILHAGLDPYRHAPAVLATVGQGRVLSAVDPFWRHTISPYGPLFVWIVSAFTGASLIAGVLLIRALELVGLVLLAVFVPRLARSLGADPGRATWLTLLSPLTLLQMVAGAHNDLLMIGLVLAGVSLAIERRVLVGIALCALAATIKLPAAVAIPFILVAYADRGTAARGVLVAIGVLLAVSLLSGLGLHWLSPSVFSTPGKVRLAITPATALGWTVAQVVPVGASGLESALRVVALAGAVLFGLALLWRTRPGNMVRYLAFALLAAALCGPAAWPWYLTWGLVLLAACPVLQSSPALIAVSILGALVIKADGVLAFPLHTAPLFVALYAAAAVAWWRRPAITTARVRPRPVAES